MNWAVIVVLALLVGYVIYETVPVEGFANPQRSDIGFAIEEPGGYIRDLRYTEAFVDLQGIGTATDFCRAVRRKNNPDSLRISCALGGRDGMDIMEYNSRSKGEGVRFSRDDYWRTGPLGRMDYCRILKDTDTGEWYPSCLVAGRTEFQRKEVRDADPPSAIQQRLNEYEKILVWFRWFDDKEDYAHAAEFQVYGTPEFSLLLKPDISRGLQLNRDLSKPLRDYLRWGETGTQELSQAIPPRQIRAISCWVWWDQLGDATILDCHNLKMADRIVLGIESGGAPIPPADTDTKPATELRPELVLALCQEAEPVQYPSPPRTTEGATYYFEIWDGSQRIMHLSSPMTVAKVGVWQHVVVTVTDGLAWWPTWQMWVNGSLVAEKKEGRLSPAMEIKENYIGKGMRGCIQDFRIYARPVTVGELTKPHIHPSP